MKLAMAITPIAGARSLPGLLMQCLAGAAGGLVFAWLRVRKQSGQASGSA